MEQEEARRAQLNALVDSFLARLRRGESPSTEEYARAHPELADLIAEVFPMLRVIEEAANAPGAGFVPEFPGIDIVREIAPGIGGMGQVFQAMETSLRRIVAVKTVKEHLHTGDGRDWFVREARAAAALDHPNIIRIFSFHPDHTPPYYVMQFVEGRPLDDACRGRTYTFRAQVFEKVARALAYAHRVGVVHRDIKPANILVDADGEPHIADFGLAKKLEAVVEGTDPDKSSLKGTPAFLPPEVYEDPARSGPASDVYALGVSLYTVLCARQPFSGSDIGEIREAVLRGEPTLPQELVQEVPEPLQRICLKAIEPCVVDRYESAEAMANDLRRFLDGREVLARPRRYQQELHGRVRDHIADISVWLDQNLIDVPAMDRLQRPYRRLLDVDPSDRDLSRRFAWETVSLRLGGWLVLVGCILWPTFYWDDLGRAERVAAVGVPALLLNFAGWYSHFRGGRINAVTFLTSGALLVPLLVAVVLSEYRVMALPQSPAREMFGEEVVLRSLVAAGKSDVADPRWAEWERPTVERELLLRDRGLSGAQESLDSRTPAERERFDQEVSARLQVVWQERVASVSDRPRTFEATNFQLLLAAASLLVYGILLLEFTRFPVYAAVIGAAVYITHFWALMLAGLLEWEARQDLTRGVLLFLPIPLLVVPVARQLRDRYRGAWSATLYSFFPLPLVMLLSLLAYTGAGEWILKVEAPAVDEQAVQLWLMAYVPVYAGIAILSAGASLAFIRFWTPWFSVMAALSCLVPCNFLFEHEPYLFHVGSEPVTLYEVGAGVLSVAFVALGTRMHRNSLTLSGLTGTAIFVFRATERHFGQSLRWPLLVTLIGTIGMLVGVTVAKVRYWRTR